MKQALKNLDEKLDNMFLHIQSIEKKIEKIVDKQSEQSRTIGVLEADIKYSEKERLELRADHKNDIDEIWNDIRRKEKMIWSAMIAGVGFVGKIIYELVSK